MCQHATERKAHLFQAPPSAAPALPLSLMSSSAPPARALRLRELLAACFSVGSHAGDVIRDVVAQGVALDVVNKADDKYDPQTVADRRSQQRIIYALRQVWPHVQIVGEEGELAAPEPEDVVVADLTALDNVSFTTPDELDGELSAEDVVLWIDPLDGTKKFAEKKYDEVSVLIGVAYKKRPVAGVMHLPFWGSCGTTYWGGRGVGLFASTHEISAAQTAHVPQERPALGFPSRPLILTTSGTPCKLVDHALAELKPAKIELGGATGTMVLTVITGASDLFFRFRNATKRWDICAVEPLLEAIGGTLVDKHGRVYEYDPQDPSQEFDNGHGLIVSLAPETTKWVLDTMAATETLRTLETDELMTLQWLSQHVYKNAHDVLSASVVPGSVHHGKHSTVFKLQVSFREASARVQGAIQQKTLFIKRYVKSELPPRSAAHWTRDLFSYRTESRFYSAFYDQLKDHVMLIEPLAVLNGKDAHGEETHNRFFVVLDSVTDQDIAYVHADCLQLGDAKQALSYLAALHASALKKPGLVTQAANELWPSGGWWSFAKRGGLSGLENISKIWESVQTIFAAEMQKAGLAVIDDAEDAGGSLAERMIRQAAYISAELFENSPESLRTIIHGDFKSANLFFQAESRAVVAFDWQWCGVGIGALDVAYFLNTSVSSDALTSEDELLRWYYDQFTAMRLDEELHQDEYPFESFERHYRLATLEYARVLLSDFWKNMTPASCATKFANTNCGLGYRSVSHVLRLITKLDEGLCFVEQERERA